MMQPTLHLTWGKKVLIGLLANLTALFFNCLWVFIHNVLLRARYEGALFHTFNFWATLFQLNGWTVHLILALIFCFWQTVVLYCFISTYHAYFLKQVTPEHKWTFLGGILASILTALYCIFLFYMETSIILDSHF